MKSAMGTVLGGILILTMLLHVAGCGQKSEKAEAPAETPRESLQEIPGIDLAGLDSGQRALALTIMNEFVCQHGCAKGLTIAQAQAKDKNCLISKRLAELVVANVKEKPAADLEEGIMRIVKGADYAASPPPEEIYSIAVGDAPTKGPKDAPVTILIYSDFQ